MTDFLKTDNAVQNTEKEIPINQLVPWENQPFKMYSDFKMNELVESIRENGLLSRIIVSPANGGKYRIIAGHNRVEACRRAGFTAVPSIVKDVDENRAKLIMADTNLCQRTELLPSERAFAYKAQQEALTALGSRRATKNIAEKYGEAKRTIQRYISCTRLVTELMEMLDSGRLTLATACQFSALPNSSQEEIAAYLSRDPERKFTVEQSNTLADLKFFSESDISGLCGDSLSGINGEIRPGIVHRIDKDTSGLLMVAKNDLAHIGLSEQIKEHSFTREYETVVCGGIKEDGIVNAPIGRHKTERKKMCVTTENSREAVTHYFVMERFPGYTHLRVRLETGRTHQIRVHMAYIGHPVAGDPVYGNGKPAWLEGQCLHAKKIGFVHPRTGEYMEFDSELPEYFQKFLKSIEG